MESADEQKINKHKNLSQALGRPSELDKDAALTDDTKTKKWFSKVFD